MSAEIDTTTEAVSIDAVMNKLQRKRLFNYSVDRMGVAKIHEEHCLS